MEALRSQISKIDGPDYEIYAVNFGAHHSYPSYLFHWLGEPPLTVPQTLMTVGFFYWVIRRSDKTILVDVGCTAQAGQLHGMASYEDHDTMLGRLGLSRKEIDSIIITHLDYDHFEGITVFEDSQAPVYIHEAAFTWHVAKARKYPILRQIGIPSAEEVQTALKLLDADRIRMVDCDRGEMTEIEPGLYALRVDGHYDGLLAIVVKTAKGLVVLASDSNYLYSNLEKKWPGGLIRTNFSDALDVFPMLDMFVSKGATIVPGHDMAIMEKFPIVHPGVARIA